MEDNFLFGKHHSLSVNNKKAAPVSFSFVFLSLILMLLSFFIYLVYTSSFEKVKFEAAKSSLHSSFSFYIPLFQKKGLSHESNNIASFHKNNIALIFPSSEIHQDPTNDEVTILINSDLIFEKTTSNLTSHATILLNQIKTLLNSNLIKGKYVVDFILFEDLTNSQNYPVYNEITTERLQKISEKMKRISVPDSVFGVGIEKGDKPEFKIHFYKGGQS